MNTIHIDFETYSEIDLAKSGAFKYAAHPSTKILCAAYYLSEYGTMHCSGSIKQKFTGCNCFATDERYIFCAHNAQFEMCIWNEILVKRLGYPKIPASRWRCSAAVCAYHSLPRSLEDATLALGLPDCKDLNGRALMLKMCKPGYDPKPGDLANLMEYCKKDVQAEMGITQKLGFLPQEEQCLWELDYEINKRGIKCDMDLARSAIVLKEAIKADLAKECQKIAGLNPSQVQRLGDWLEKQGLKLKDMRSETLKKLLATLPDGKVKTVIQIRKDFATTSLAKYDAAMSYGQKGIVRGQFVYHGCSTGRWSGRGVQFQNLPRGSFNEETVSSDMKAACAIVKAEDLGLLRDMFPTMRPMEVLKSAIRGMVVPRKDFSLFVLDFSQIEARVLAWLAGQQEVLDAFVAGKDLYKFTASQIYCKKYEDVDKKERFIGKVASLALGYQGGAGAFQSMALNYGVVVDADLAERVKDDWRFRNPRIVKFWYDLDDGMRQAVSLRKTIVVRKRITIRVKDDFMTIELPSGRKLWYYKPMIKDVKRIAKDGSEYIKSSVTYMGSDSQHNVAWGRIAMYGGKAAENITQAVSRDIMVSGVWKTEGLGYNTIITVHDEVVAEADKKRSIEPMQNAMEELPSWASGLPLKAAGFKTERYYKG